MAVLIGFLYFAVRMGTPLLFATTGEILSERVGNLNLGAAIPTVCSWPWPRLSFRRRCVRRSILCSP